MKPALNCWPWIPQNVRSLTHSPLHSDPLPDRNDGGVPDRPSQDRDRPRALMRRTQNPLSAVVERHPLDEASQNLLVWRFLLSPGRTVHDVPSAVVVFRSVKPGSSASNLQTLSFS